MIAVDWWKRKSSVWLDKFWVLATQELIIPYFFIFENRHTHLTFDLIFILNHQEINRGNQRISLNSRGGGVGGLCERFTGWFVFLTNQLAKHKDTWTCGAELVLKFKGAGSSSGTRLSYEIWVWSLVLHDSQSFFCLNWECVLVWKYRVSQTSAWEGCSVWESVRAHACRIGFR